MFDVVSTRLSAAKGGGVEAEREVYNAAYLSTGRRTMERYSFDVEYKMSSRATGCREDHAIICFSSSLLPTVGHLAL